MKAAPAGGLLLLLALTACARSGDTFAQAHVLRIADNVDPTSLNPLLAHDQTTIGYDLLVTETLVGLSASNKLVPILVTRVPSSANGDISPDGKTIVYHLRRGVRFADGTELTSRDVAFTFHAILDPHNPVESQDAYRRVVALQTPGPYIVVIRLKQRWNAAVAELFAQADFAFGILPAHAFASTDVVHAVWNQHPFGTGPFRVVDWQRANRIVLEPNPYYSPRPKLHRIVFLLIPTTQASLLALRTHEADVVQVVDPAQIPTARSIAGARLVRTPVNGEYEIIARMSRGPTDDVHVRRAIAAAIDPREIARASFGVLTPADSFLPPVFSWHDPAPAMTSSDPGLVARELQAGGWRASDGAWRKAGRPLSVTIDFEPAMGSWIEVLVQEQLRRAGIDARVKPFPPALFNAPGGPLRGGTFTLASTQWIGAADPEQSVVFACGQRGGDGNNDSNYCNPRFDALFLNQSVSSDPLRRRRDFVDMQRIIRRDAPVMPLAFQSNVDAISVRVSGFARNMLMYPVAAANWDVR